MTGSSNLAALHGLTVLIVEDETIFALELEAIVTEAGGSVLGPAATVEGALLLLRDNTPAVALLDVQLLNGMITPVAATLRALEVPFVLVSGYTGPELRKPALVGAPNVGKPVRTTPYAESLGTGHGLLSRQIGSGRSPSGLPAGSRQLGDPGARHAALITP